MESVAILAGMSLGVACWWGLVRCMRINGRPWWWRHLAGVLLVNFAMAGLSLFLASLLGASGEDGEPLGATGAIGGLMVALPMLLPLAFSWKAARERHNTVPVATAEPAAAPEPSRKASSSSGNLRFIYEDAQGSLSTREVSSWRASSRYIKGFCLERGALRTFRRDRIVKILDGEELLSRNSEPAPAPQRHDRPLEVLLTGFDADVQSELEQEAASEGLKVRKSLTQNLDFLCAGPNTGPRKLSEARAKGAVVMDEPQFFDFLETGALPG